MKIVLAAFTANGVYASQIAKGRLQKQRKLIGEGNYISDWWYLHGKLESKIGYDKAQIVSIKGLRFKEILYKDDNTNRKIYYLENGIYDVKVLGVKKPCVGYFWTIFKKFDNIEGEVPTMHGLVCYKSDEEAVKDAERKYHKRSEWLQKTLLE